jgi:REP element-mobilizing transposase RayT
MPYDPQKHHRRSIRIQGFDYAQPGAYFITFVTQNRECFLSLIIDGSVSLEPAGKAVLSVWQELPKHYRHLTLGDIVIMPNHVHAVLFFNPNGNATGQALPEIVRALKSFSARRINTLRAASGSVVWQQNYFEHIVRDNEDLCRIREYIWANPIHWDLDEENPSRG